MSNLSELTAEQQLIIDFINENKTVDRPIPELLELFKIEKTSIFKASIRTITELQHKLTTLTSVKAVDETEKVMNEMVCVLEGFGAKVENVGETINSLTIKEFKDLGFFLIRVIS